MAGNGTSPFLIGDTSTQIVGFPLRLEVVFVECFLKNHTIADSAEVSTSITTASFVPFGTILEVLIFLGPGWFSGRVSLLC